MQYLLMAMLRLLLLSYSSFFFFNDTATTEIYTLSLHDALPISRWATSLWREIARRTLTSIIRSCWRNSPTIPTSRDRKSTRLNSSHSSISYAVFCLKKKKNTKNAKHYSRAAHEASTANESDQDQ